MAKKSRGREFILKYKFYLVIVILSFAPLIPFLVVQDLAHTHDGLVHLPRQAAYFRALTDGQIPVRWAGYLNYGYGLPLFNFIYQLPYLIGSSLLFIGFGLVNTFKISLSLSFILSGIFMFAFARELFNNNRKAFLIAIFYQFAPFRLVELLVRGSYGEVYTYTFLPLVLLGILLTLKKFTFSRFLLTAVSTALLVISHNSVSLLFFGVALLFIIFFAKSIKNFIIGSVGLFYGLVLASFYWVPALLERKFTYGDLLMRSLYVDHFTPIQNFFIPNILNHTSFFTEGINTSIGLFHTFAIILTILLLILRKVEDRETRRLFLFSLVLILGSLFFMLSISRPIWGLEAANLLRQFQFPWRFLSIVVVATSFLAVSFFSFPRFNRKWTFIGLAFFVIFSTVAFWKPSLGVDKIDEDYYWNFPLNTTYYGETDIIWSAGPAKSYPENRVELIDGEGEINGFLRTNNEQNFETVSDENIRFVSHTQYFPGWRVYVDGDQVPIEFQDPNHRGEITFDVPSGEHNVSIKFGESFTRAIANGISVFGLLMFFPLRLILKRARL